MVKPVLRHPTGFTLLATSQVSFEEQLNGQFSNLEGYCAAKFHTDPPPNAEAGLNDCRNLETNIRESYYECRGIPVIISASFSNSGH